MTEHAEVAAALEAALPKGNVKAWDDRGNPISLKVLSAVMASELRDQGWLLVRSSLVPLPTSNDTTFTEQADYGSDTR